MGDPSDFLVSSSTNPIATSSLSNQSDAPIKNVTIFPNRAVIKRIWAKELKAGVHHIRFNGFSLQRYVTGTLRVDVDGPSILLQDVQETYTEEYHRLSAAELKERVGDAKSKKADLESQILFAEKRLEVWEDYRKIVTAKAGGQLASVFKEGAFTDLHDFLWKYEGEFFRLQALLQKLREELETANVLTDRLLQRRPPVSCNVGDIKIMLNVLKSDKVRIGISYTVKEANWSPSYDIRIDGDTKQTKVSYFCWARQWTGEDWSNAEVAVAADQFSQDDVFELKDINGPPSWYPKSSPDPLKDRTDSLTKGSPVENPLENKSSVSYQENRFSISKRSVTPFSTLVDRDGLLGHERPTRFLVASTTTDIRTHHTCHPSKSLDVQVTCTMANQTQIPFLPGPASVYSSGNYVFNVQLEHVNPNEEFDLMLPSDPSVQVIPKYPVRTTKPIGPTEGNFIVESEFTMEYEVKNNRKQQISLTLTESYPRTHNERVKVTLINPKASAQEQQEGKVCHHVDVPANVTRSVKTIFKVQHPNGMRRPLEYLTHN